MVFEESKEPAPVRAPVEKKNIDRNVLFVIPFAVPGSGKSFCWNILKAHLDELPEWSYQAISSDEIRGELI